MDKVNELLDIRNIADLYKRSAKRDDEKLKELDQVDFVAVVVALLEKRFDSAGFDFLRLVEYVKDISLAEFVINKLDYTAKDLYKYLKFGYDSNK